MHRLQLSDDLLTGNAEIDRQHRELYRLGNELLFPTDAQQEARAFRHGLRFLVRYTRDHFAAEEGAMRRQLYPRLEQHQRQHQRFRREIEQVRAVVRIPGGAHKARLRLHFLLTDWFAQHLRYQDRDLAAFLREQGEAEAVEALASRHAG